MTVHIVLALAVVLLILGVLVLASAYDLGRWKTLGLVGVLIGSIAYGVFINVAFSRLLFQ